MNESSEKSIDEMKIEILPESSTISDFNFKVIIIGDSGVGKSSLTKKATKNIFESDQTTTIGFEFCTLNFKLDNKEIRLQIWDTCGQEAYKSLITNFYRNASLAIITYSIDSEESFKNIENWIKDLKANSNPDVKMMLIGCKNDLEDKRKISTEHAQKIASDYEMCLFMETSAKTGFNAQEVFIKGVKILYMDYKKYKEQEFLMKSSSSVSSDNESLKLTDQSETNEKKKCCK